MLSLSKSERTLSEYVSITKKQRKEERHKQWKEKKLYGKFERQPEYVRSEETWGWISRCYLNKETDGLIFAAQEQALEVRWPRGIRKMYHVS